MPKTIVENDLGQVQIVVTQEANGVTPSVVVTATTSNENGIPGRTLSTEEVYSKLGTQAQTLIRSVCTSIRNRAKAQEGI